ncbi:uncharacterized protein LOC141785537 [Halichoeres trimaculatus]|uniref:uncharacterized protein LOC141785365 n=1 Tax=Halichoeres trimaculatus TaxID=147232 RepID=UPI003D9E48CA
MPRTKSSRRSEAAARRLAERQPLDITPTWRRAREEDEAVQGTGQRHRILRWPVSTLTRKSHKLVIPPESSDKEFVLLVGDSHLRAIVDGFVEMPKGLFSFGIMSTPGAAAHEERIELIHAEVPRTPAAVVLVAPSNNLTHSKTIESASADFAMLLSAAMERWSNVAVLEFPPRISSNLQLQQAMSQEYHRVSARMGVRYFPAFEHFPLRETDLWARDGIHLSDTAGMPILARLLWQAAYDTLKPLPQTTCVQVPTPPKPSVPQVKPRLVVRGEVPTRRPPVNPFTEWTTVRQRRRGSSSGESSLSSGVVPKKRMVGKQVLKECAIPLTPVWFSAALLDEMEKVAPSHLPAPAECRPVPKGKQKAFVEQKKAAVSKRSRSVRQAEAVPCVGGVKSQATPATVVPEMVGEEVPVPHVSPACPVSSVSPVLPVSPRASPAQAPEVEVSSYPDL